jgi:hypothetical protein
MAIARETWLAAAVLLVGACGDGTGTRGRAASERPSTSASPAVEVAGGQTSEFSGGDIAYCLEVGASFIPLDLESLELASWVALASGHHEATLVWQPGFVTDAIGGFEAHTSLSLDVTVLSARDVVFGPGQGYEDSGCQGQRQRQIELAIELSTADGALSGSLRHFVSPITDASAPGRRVLSSTIKADNSLYPLGDFASTLELDVRPEGELSRELGFGIGFDAASARGTLAVSVTSREPTSEVGRGVWRPLSATFPDDGCGPNLPVALDAESDVLSESPLAAYGRIRDVLERAAIPAMWHNLDSALPGEGSVERTEVTLRAGDPTHACRAGQSVEVHAPLSVESADGRVRHTRSMAWALSETGVTLGGSVPWQPARDFEVGTGVQGVELGAAEFGGVFLHHYTDFMGDEIHGGLTPTKWEGFEERGTGYGLEWCAGAICADYMCRIQGRSSQLGCP